MSIKNFRIAFFKRSRILVFAGAVIAVLTAIHAVSTIVAVSLADSRVKSAIPQSTAPQSAFAGRPTGPVQVVRLTLYDAGIVPQQSYAHKSIGL